MGKVAKKDRKFVRSFLSCGWAADHVIGCLKQSHKKGYALPHIKKMQFGCWGSPATDLQIWLSNGSGIGIQFPFNSPWGTSSQWEYDHSQKGRGGWAWIG